VLLQKKEDGKRHPIAYFSKTLNEAQRNYDIADLELLGGRNVIGQLEIVFGWITTQGHRILGPSKSSVLERTPQDQ
jgi:hypothetical protein